MIQLEAFPVLRPPAPMPLLTVLKDFSMQRRRQFLIWHRKHPDIWKLVEKAFINKARQGQQRIGVKEIFEQLRQEYVEQTNKTDGWKLNNNWTSVYARLLAYKYPELASRIELRTTGRN